MKRFVVLIAMGILLLPVMGCGGKDGPPRYKLSGKVTYEGKPVPRGTVSFSPDSRGGNSGPGSIAQIKNGEYATERDRGVVGGAYEVRINGTDGVAVGEMLDGTPLFKEYQIVVDLPKKVGTHDFEVPSGGGKDLKNGALPPP